MPLFATFFTSCWSATTSLEMTVSLTVEAANGVGDVGINPDLQVANFQCFRGRWGVEGKDKGASGFPDTFP